MVTEDHLTADHIQFVDATLADPSSLDIYFYGENDTDLILSNMNAYAPMTTPYTDICFY